MKPKQRKTYEVKRIVYEFYYVEGVNNPEQAQKEVARQLKPLKRIIKSEIVKRVNVCPTHQV